MTQGLLLKIAKQVDVIEPVVKFTDLLKGKDGVGRIHNVGLEDWKPEKEDCYDLIWIQWCVGHLNDAQLVNCLERCKAALNPNGAVIVIKENLSSIDIDMFDEVDSSITRWVNRLPALGVSSVTSEQTNCTQAR